MEIAIAKYRNHPSINAITEKMKKSGNPTFGFDFTFNEQSVKGINNSRSRKVSQKKCKHFQGMQYILFLISCIITLITRCHAFPTCMKYAEVTPTHKKDDKTDKENDRPTSILLHLSKVYERLMYNQIFTLLSSFQCGFRKGFNAQHCLSPMIERWCKTLDEGGETGRDIAYV